MSGPEEETSKSTPPGYFCKSDEGWFFKESDGGELGPFDEVIELVLGEWKTSEQTITEPELSNMLPEILTA